MYQKFLFIGLGGSGGKTLRFLKEQIAGWLKEHGLTRDDFPAGWQFLHIDVPGIPDGDEIDRLAARLAPSEYLGLIRGPMEFTTVQRHLDNEKNLRDELVSWRVEPANLSLNLTQGAGQYRAVGQAVAMSYAGRINKAIEEAIAKMNGPGTNVELSTLYHQVFGGRSPKQTTQQYVVVVSSLAGGSGAGMLSIVCDLVRGNTEGAGNNLFAILYTPEVFSGLAEVARGGVQANSLAATSEMLNGIWFGSGQEETLNPVLAWAGSSTPLNRYGPQYPFLVGKRNAEGVEYGSAEQLFSAVGRSLLSWVTDLTMQARFLAYTTGNWASMADHNAAGQDVLVGEGERSEVGLPPFSALGFSRLSVGADYLARYACEVLARDVFTNLMDYHHASTEAEMVKVRTNEHDPEKVADRLATMHLEHYKQQVSLDSADQLFQALNPKNEHAEYAAIVRRISEHNDIGDPEANAPVQDWLQPVDQMVETTLKPGEPPKEFREAAQNQRDQWVTQVQENVIKATAEIASLRGLKVAALAVRKTANFVAVDMRDELRKSSADYSHWAESWQSEALRDSGLHDVTGKLTGDDPRLADYVREAVRYRWTSYTADIYDDAANLTSQVVSRLLEQVANELEQAWWDASAQRELFPDWSIWLDGDELPEPDAASGPPLGDFTLIEIEEYKGLLEEKMKDSFGSNWRDEVRSEIMTGLSDGKGIISTRIHWQPEGATTRPAFAQATVTVSREALLDAANDLLNREGSPMEKLLGLSLKTSLDVRALDDSVSYGDRLLAKLPACIDSAAPLIDIDRAILNQVHTRSSSSPLYESYFSSLPLAGHKLTDRVKEILSAKGVSQEQMSDLFQSDDRARHIDITSSLAAPHSPLVFESLLKPIADDWMSHCVQNTQHLFWMHRRARPMARTVPCSQATLLCMTRGWFTALLLGLTSELPTVVGRDQYPAVSVSRGWRGGTRPPVEFPTPLLTTPRKETDYPGVLLESLILAYVEVSRRSQLTPLNPYIELRDLGQSAGESVGEYPTLHRSLKEWVEMGALPEGADPQRALLTTEPGWTATERAKHLENVVNKLLQEYQEQYKNLSDRWEDDPTQLSKAPLWAGMADILFQALEQMREVAQ